MTDAGVLTIFNPMTIRLQPREVSIVDTGISFKGFQPSVGISFGSHNLALSGIIYNAQPIFSDTMRPYSVVLFNPTDVEVLYEEGETLCQVYFLLNDTRVQLKDIDNVRRGKR